MRIQQLDKNTKTHLLEDLLKRSPNNYGKYEAGVLKILSRVREEGDQAVFDFTRQFDQADITADTIRVTKEEIEEAYTLVDETLISIIRKALKNIREYHEKQKKTLELGALILYGLCRIGIAIM
jgi:histidinol dehydrogenase